MIEAALSEIGKKCSNAEIKRVAGELGMTYTMFCNSVARGGIPVSDVLERMELDELPDIVNEKKQTAKTDTTSISIVVSDAFASKVKQAAKLHGVNVSAYIKNLIAETVNDDSRSYDERMIKERESWNT
jgi:predicted DNA binding CopG/RHH family protein